MVAGAGIVGKIFARRPVPASVIEQAIEGQKLPRVIAVRFTAHCLRHLVA